VDLQSTNGTWLDGGASSAPTCSPTRRSASATRCCRSCRWTRRSSSSRSARPRSRG
jgi:hypothetical protein